MAVYYNEIEPFAAAWLRELMKAGLIADGTVDERPIEQVEPSDLKGFTQCHFFAGIGVWSYALRAAGWADDSPVWTGSCPCQSFSASGKRGGFSDKRHLWPAWFRLIEKCSPHVIFGEQVGGQGGKAWFDTVSADLEGIGYAVGAAITGACGFGAPHMRKRLYFVADAAEVRRRQPEYPREIHGAPIGEQASLAQTEAYGLSSHGASSRLADTERAEQSREWAKPNGEQSGLADAGDLGDSALDGRREGRPQPERQQGRPDAAQPSRHDILGDTEREQLRATGPGSTATPERALQGGDGERERLRDDSRQPGLTNGFWADCEWLPCRDHKFRPTQPGLFPLATGSAKRVGRLRGYGNCIVAPQAQGFIEAYSEAMHSAGSGPVSSKERASNLRI